MVPTSLANSTSASQNGNSATRGATKGVSSPKADSVAAKAGAASQPEQDFYLHLHLPPELDLPLPATTQIYHQPPTSYLIPRWDLGPQSGAFTRIEFPTVGSRAGVQEDLDTFETILAQCTSFLERQPAPRKSPKLSSGASGRENVKTPASISATGASAASKPKASSSSKTSSRSTKARKAGAEELPAYNPGNYSPGEGYAQGSMSTKPGGRIVLVDEEDGSVLGELGESYQLQDSAVQPGSKGESFSFFSKRLFSYQEARSHSVITFS